MKIGVITCGALGERGIILENAIQKLMDNHGQEIISFSATITGTTPKLLSMTGITSSNLISVNSCNKRCSDLILKGEGLKPTQSINMDEILDQDLRGCETETFVYKRINNESFEKFEKLLDDTFEDVKKDVL
jgi:uncharacterized metal-binding protein|tara:strand:- start:1398 stop:1793 length:396 start_codon:yes stop_codon:yes gene_type:complete